MNRKGVTLLELITVMMIIAFGALLLAPNIGAWLPNYRLRSATRDIVSTMRTAQMKAVSNNTVYGVAFDGNTFQLYGTIGGVLQAEGGPYVLPSGVQFDSNNFPVNGTLGKPFAQFNSNSTSSSGTVTLRNTKSATKSITVSSSTGRIKIN
jgi:type IV fimbrial biogenesis protein FimT